jgi:flagellar hook-basal body complex protein FliE
MVSPINPVQVPWVDGASQAGRAGEAGAAGRAGEVTESAGFGDAVGDALSEVARREDEAEQAAEAAAVGDLSSVSDYMIAATEAQLATESRWRSVTAPSTPSTTS